MTASTQRTGGRIARPSKNPPPEELEALLTPIAEQAVAKRQTLGQALHAGPLAQLLGRFVELALYAEMTHHLHSSHLEHESAPNCRNGSFERQLKTPLGQVTIQRPRDRNASFEPTLLPKHGQLSDTIASQILSLYTRGMTTRDIRAHLSELYHTDFESDLVSRVLEKVEPELVAWRSQALPSTMACIFVDCIYLKIRHETGVDNTAAYVAIGYDLDGMQHILGVWIPEDGQKAESVSYWHQVFVELKRRGLEDILILCADGLAGMEGDLEVDCPKTRFQTCVVHMIKNSTKEVPWKDRSQACQDLREIYQAVSWESAQQGLQEFVVKWRNKYPNFVKVWQTGLSKLENLWSYGDALSKMVYPTNALENVNRQIKKGTKTRSQFPTRESALRLLTLILRQVQADKKKPRSDWSGIHRELAIHFPDRVH